MRTSDSVTSDTFWMLFSKNHKEKKTISPFSIHMHSVGLEIEWATRSHIQTNEQKKVGKNEAIRREDLHTSWRFEPVEFRRLNLSCCFKRLKHIIFSDLWAVYTLLRIQSDRVRFSWFLPMHSVLATLCITVVVFCFRFVCALSARYFCMILQCVYMNQAIQR